MYPEDFHMPEMFRQQHFFRDIDMEELISKEAGLLVEMEFGEDFGKSYHLQLRILNTIFPDAIGVIDYSAEKVLSGVWVALAAKSNITPAPRYLFTVQAVSGEEDDVWLHTHGLNRCGLMEVEVIGSKKETCQDHFHILEATAVRLIDEPWSFSEDDAINVAYLSNGMPLMVTWVPWQDAVKNVSEDTLGGINDRKEENGHAGYTGAIYMYLTPEDMENGQYSHIDEVDDLLCDNPMIMITNKETERMKMQAIERIDYLKRAVNEGCDAALIKVGLHVDEEHRTKTNEFEHIWFELNELGKDTFMATLTQEPYYVAGLHEGAVMEIPYTDITDWIIFTEGGRIVPDEVYLMELR